MPRVLMLTTGLLALLLVAHASPTAAQSPRADDETAIDKVIQKSYIDGVFRLRDPDLVRGGFAPTFVMQVYWDGKLSSRTLDAWLERMKLDRTPNPKEYRGEVKVLEITGVAAVARIDVFEDSTHKYTDYFGLYKTADGWKIVSKIFHAHG